jgi:hypothetical protein
MAVIIIGNTIREIYSVVGWQATEARVVTESQVNAINNNRLLAGSFPLDFDREIDYRMFQLVGVDSLDDIATGDVVYVYVNEFVANFGAGTGTTIRKVAVGQEVVEGSIDAVREDPANIRIDGTNYPFARAYLNPVARVSAADVANFITSIGEDAVAKLDAFGNVFELTADSGLRNFGVYVEANFFGVGHQVAMHNTDDEEQLFTMGRTIAHVPATPGIKARVPDQNPLFDVIAPDATTSPFDPIAGSVSPDGLVLYGYGLNSTGNINELQSPFMNGTIISSARLLTMWPG